MTFEEYVTEWQTQKAKIDKLKAEITELGKTEMTMRKSIVEAVEKAQPLKEGMNTFEMADGRELKINNKIDRKIDSALIAATREEYNLLNDRDVNFDDLLRVKYEVEMREFRKLGDEGAKVISKMITAKPAAPEVKVA